MTIIECISPSRLSVPPSFVLSSRCIPSFPDLSGKISAIVTSPNGWTDNEIGTAWFAETFIPFANGHKVSDAPIVLLLDGHNSHKSDAFHEASFQHNIIVIAFPSKCTHKLQPLDIIVFTQTQCHWSAHCDNRIIHYMKMDRYNIIPEYMEIHPQSMTPELMHLAFTTTGIFPFNDTLFTNDGFAPARSFSHTMHAPISFPPEVPSSPPLASDLSDCEMSDDKSSTAESMATDAPEAQVYHNWETDSDNFNYNPAPSHLTAPAAATTPTEALPSPLTVPVTGMNTSSQLMQAMLAPSTLASCSLPITPSIPLIFAPSTVSHYMGTSELPRPSDTASVNMDPHATQLSPYYICSQASQITSLSVHSSSAVSISIALNPAQAPQPQSIQELLSENHRLKMTLDLVEKENTKLKANNDASNAHCTIMTRAATTVRADLDCQKHVTHRAVKTSTHYVAHPAIEDEWNTSQQDKAQHAKEATEVEAQRATDEALREACIQEEIRTRTFSSKF
jgi:hypothetical protein